MFRLLFVLNLFVALVNCALKTNWFQIEKNVTVNSNTGLMLSIYTENRLFCLKACSSNDLCINVVYSQQDTPNNCYLYNTAVQITNQGVGNLYKKHIYCELVTTGSQTNCFSRNTNAIDFFKNATLLKTINTYSNGSTIFQNAMGVGVNAGNGNYYVLDNSANKTIIFDEAWNYVAFQPASKPRYMYTIPTGAYISSSNGLQKIDYNFTTLTIVTTSGLCFNDIFYDPSTQQVLTWNLCNNTVNVYTSDLVPVSSINAAMSWSVTSYNGKIYIGTYASSILEYTNGLLTNTYSGVCTSGTVTSIFFDNMGFLYVSCLLSKTINLYYPNMTFTGYSINLTIAPYSIRYDTKGRLIVCGGSSIQIYH